MGLDIALVGRGGPVGALDHAVGLAQPRLDVAMPELHPRDHVG